MSGKVVFSMVAGLVLGGAAPAVHAQGPGFYLGAGYGITSVDTSNMEIAEGMVAADPTYDPYPSVNADTEDTGWKIYLGYQFNDYFAVEVEYADLGSYHGSYEATFTDPYYGEYGFENGTFHGSADGYGVSAVGLLPLNDRFELFGKVGVFKWKAKGGSDWYGTSYYDHDTVSVAQYGEYNFEGSESGSDDGTDLMFGAGAKWHINDRFALRAEWERFTKVYDYDVDFFSLNLEASF